MCNVGTIWLYNMGYSSGYSIGTVYNSTWVNGSKFRNSKVG